MRRWIESYACEIFFIFVSQLLRNLYTMCITLNNITDTVMDAIKRTFFLFTEIRHLMNILYESGDLNSKKEQWTISSILINRNINTINTSFDKISLYTNWNCLMSIYERQITNYLHYTYYAYCIYLVYHWNIYCIIYIMFTVINIEYLFRQNNLNIFKQCSI